MSNWCITSYSTDLYSRKYIYTLA